MLSSCKHVVVDYNTLIIKIWEDHVGSETTRSNVQKVLNAKLIYSLHWIMLLFELAHTLIKLVGTRDGRTQSAHACLFFFPSLQTHPPKNLKI
jgi:hypothetical protein